MRYRYFPNTNLTVSEVGFGLWTTGTDWWGEMRDADALQLIQEAFDLGITFFDAADTYGNGRSEEQLAAALGAHRDEVVYATKFGYDFYTYGGNRRGQYEIPKDFSPTFLRYALEQSLRRLKTDVIDLYQVHNAEMSEIENDELFALLETFKQEGKIRYYGVALGPAIGYLYEGIDSIRKRNVTSVQMIWNMIEQHPGSAMIEAARRLGADTGFQVRVPHSSGLLEGKYTEATVFPLNDHRRHRPTWWLPNGLEKVRQLRFLETPERTLGQAAIQWLLREPRVVTVLPNIYDRNQLREFAGAVHTPALTRDELVQIDQLFQAQFGVVEPATRYQGTMVEATQREAV
jgi:aryl-alcohol dehydrogenase-like predicted oxidoreductase